MLNALRKSAGTWVVRILLGLLIISLALWGLDGIFRSGSTNVVAQVGDREISQIEFERNYQQQRGLLSQRLGRRINEREARMFGIRQSVLQNLIQTTALDIHAAELGLGISDDAIRSAIQTEPAFRVGDSFSRAQFEQALRNLGLSEQGFVAEQREDMIRQQVISAFSQSVVVPKTMLEAIYHHRNDARVLSYFIIEPSVVGEVQAPGETALKTYYDENKTRYMAPEYRKIGVLMLTPDAVKDTISLTDEQLRAQYEANKARYVTPERRTIQQLVFDDMEAAREASKKLAEGEDFVALGKGLGMTDSDINLGTFTQDALANRNVAEAAFQLEEGAVSEPIESFSPVIVKVTDIQAGETRTFEDVKEEVRSTLASERARTEIQDLYDAIEDARAAGSNVKEAAEKLNLPYQEYTLDRQGQNPEGSAVEPISGNREAINLTFESDVGVENNPVTVGDGYAFIDVLEMMPERQKTFEEVRDEVRTAWIEAETRKRVREKAEELVGKAKAGAGLESLAGEIGATVSKTAELNRQATPETLPRTAVPLAFTLPEDGYGNVQMPGQRQAVIQVAEIRKAPPMTQAQSDNLRTELRQTMAGDILAQYIGTLQSDYGVQVNNQAFSASSLP